MAKHCTACTHNHDPNTTCDTCGHFWVSQRFPSVGSTNCFKFISTCFGEDEVVSFEEMTQMLPKTHLMTHDASMLRQLSLRSLLATARLIFRNVFASEMGLQSELEAISAEETMYFEEPFDMKGFLVSVGNACKSGAQISTEEEMSLSSTTSALNSFSSQRYVLLAIGNSPVGCARWRIVHSRILGDVSLEALRGGGSALNDGPSPDYVALIDRFAICENYRKKGCGKQLIVAILNDVYGWAVKAAAFHNHDPLAYLPAVATLLPQVEEFDPALRLFAQKARFVLLNDALKITPYNDPSRIFSRAIYERKPTKDLNLNSTYGKLDPISLAAAGGSTTYMQLAILMLPPSLVIDTLRRQ